MSNPLTASLNPAQKRAVTMPPGPALVLAGAGSGKTRVITHRVAWLIEQKLATSDQVLAMTFTNRAAAEMRERIEDLCGSTARQATITTFHSACARWLRRHARLAGLTPNFSIYDTDDSRSLVRRCAKDLSMAFDAGATRQYLQRIDDAHNKALSAHQLETDARTLADEEFVDLFRSYHHALQQASAVDFGTLITTMLELLEGNERLRDRFQEDYPHILVDEFQDTNAAQYRLLRALAGPGSSVMVVGDDDQSIYGWRGAEVENVRRFVRDYEPVEVIKLEQNYRSTAPILRSAHALVESLPDRMPKELQAVRSGETRPTLFIAADDREEAEHVSEQIQQQLEDDNRSYKDFAIFYRTNAQSRVFEQRLRADGIPHRLIGSVGYFDRKEVRDIIAWLRLISNPADDAAFERVLKSPPRGVGDVTLQRLQAFREGYPNWLHALEAWPESAGAKRSRRAAAGIEALAELLREFEVQKMHLSTAELIEAVLSRTDYLAWLEKSEPESYEDRALNIHELIHAAREIARETDDNTVGTFVERVTLVSSRDEGEDGDAVLLMTVHTSKGLEFPVVFVTGLEEGMFPLTPRAQEEDAQSAHQEEERRLAYVALTRAEDRLFLSAVQRRQRFGSVNATTASVFLRELLGGDHIDFHPDSAQKSLDWNVARREQLENAYREVERRYDEFDQRPWSERARAAEDGESIPDEGVIFDDRFYPEDSTAAARGWIGRSARHKLFGVGEIVDADPTGDRVRLTIRFPEVGIKKVIADYVELL